MYLILFTVRFIFLFSEGGVNWAFFPEVVKSAEPVLALPLGRNQDLVYAWLCTVMYYKRPSEMLQQKMCKPIGYDNVCFVPNYVWC